MRFVFQDADELEAGAQSLAKYIRANPGSIVTIEVIFTASPLVPVLQRIIRVCKLGQKQVAAEIGMSVPFLSLLLSGKRPLTYGTALRVRNFLLARDQHLTSKDRRALEF